MNTTDVNVAAELLVTMLTDVLDKIAPVKTIQTRTRYAPWVGKNTKDLQKDRDEAQEKAALTGNPEERRQCRSLRNQATAGSRADKKELEKQKKDNASKGIWKSVRGGLTGVVEVTQHNCSLEVEL